MPGDAERRRADVWREVETVCRFLRGFKKMQSIQGDAATVPPPSCGRWNAGRKAPAAGSPSLHRSGWP